MPQLSTNGIWKITYPVLLSLLMQYMIGAIDSAFLGRLGEVELGAGGLGSIYYLSFYMLGFGFSIGAQIIMARRNGEGHVNGIGPVFMQGLFFLIALGGICVWMTRYSAPLVLNGVIESTKVYEATIEYIDWRSFGYVSSFAALIFRAFFVGTTRTGILTLNAAIMLGVNSVLNYLLIFGKFGFPEWGIAGAGIASAIAETVSLVFLTVYTLLSVPWRQYELFRLTGLKLKLLYDVLSLSIWTMLQSFAAMGVWFVFFVAVEHLGEKELAISNAVRNVSAMLFMFVSAFSTTANSLVSNMIGSGQTRLVIPLAKKLVKMCLVSQLPFLIVVMVFPRWVLGVFTDDPELASSSVGSLWVMASSYLLHVPAFVYLSVVTGTGNTRRAMGIEFSALGIYLVSVIWLVIYLKSNIAICWFTEHIYAVGLFLLCWHYMKGDRWKNKKV